MIIEVFVFWKASQKPILGLRPRALSGTRYPRACWVLLGPPGSSLVLLAPPGSSWVLLAPPGPRAPWVKGNRNLRWLSCQHPGSSWLLLGAGGPWVKGQRKPQVATGSSWLLLPPPAPPRLLLASPGSSWPPWLLLAPPALPPGSSWLLLAGLPRSLMELPRRR